MINLDKIRLIIPFSQKLPSKLMLKANNMVELRYLSLKNFYLHNSHNKLFKHKKLKNKMHRFDKVIMLLSVES